VVESLRQPTGASGLSEFDGLDALYREQAPRMWRALTAYTGSRDLAQDAVAEAFAQAIARGKAIHSIERWVWKAAYRIAAGELKRRGTHVEMATEVPVISDRSEGVAEEVREALSKLSEMQRAAVVLHYYAGYPARDIARITRSTPAAVWVHLSRGRRELRRLLEEDDD